MGAGERGMQWRGRERSGTGRGGRGVSGEEERGEVNVCGDEEILTSVHPLSLLSFLTFPPFNRYPNQATPAFVVMGNTQ